MSLKIEVKIDGFDCDIHTQNGQDRLLSAWLGDACPQLLRDVHATVFRYLPVMADEAYLTRHARSVVVRPLKLVGVSQNHHSFEVDFYGDRVATVAEVKAAVTEKFPRWKATNITKQHLDITFENGQHNGYCTYRTGGKFTGEEIT